jgi:hypothetical protein
MIGGAGTALFQIPYTTTQELADGCAAKQRELVASGDPFQPQFTVTTAPGGLYNSGFNCQTSVQALATEACTATNGAFYAPA